MKTELKLLLLCNYLNLFGFGLFTPIYAIFVLGLGGTAFEAASSWALYGFITGGAILFFGRLEDSSFNKHKLVAAGYFAAAAGALAFYFVENFTQFYIALAVNALAVGILLPAWKALYTKYEDRGAEAGEWSLFDGGNYISAAIAALAGGYLITFYGFKSLFLSMFAIQILAAFVSLKLLKGKAKKKA